MKPSPLCLLCFLLLLSSTLAVNATALRDYTSSKNRWDAYKPENYCYVNSQTHVDGPITYYDRTLVAYSSYTKEFTRREYARFKCTKILWLYTKCDKDNSTAFVEDNEKKNIGTHSSPLASPARTWEDWYSVCNALIQSYDNVIFTMDEQFFMQACYNSTEGLGFSAWHGVNIEDSIAATGVCTVELSVNNLWAILAFVGIGIVAYCLYFCCYSCVTGCCFMCCRSRDETSTAIIRAPTLKAVLIYED